MSSYHAERPTYSCLESADDRRGPACGHQQLAQRGAGHACVLGGFLLQDCLDNTIRQAIHAEKATHGYLESADDAMLDLACELRELAECIAEGQGEDSDSDSESESGSEKEEEDEEGEKSDDDAPGEFWTCSPASQGSDPYSGCRLRQQGHREEVQAGSGDDLKSPLRLAMSTPGLVPCPSCVMHGGIPRKGVGAIA